MRPISRRRWVWILRIASDASRVFCVSAVFFYRIRLVVLSEGQPNWGICFFRGVSVYACQKVPFPVVHQEEAAD